MSKNRGLVQYWVFFAFKIFPKLQLQFSLSVFIYRHNLSLHLFPLPKNRPIA